MSSLQPSISASVGRIRWTLGKLRILCCCCCVAVSFFLSFFRDLSPPCLRPEVGTEHADVMWSCLGI